MCYNIEKAHYIMKKKMTSAEINTFIKANYATKSNQELSKFLGISPNAIQHRANNMGISRTKVNRDIEVPDDKLVEKELIEAKTKSKKRDISKKVSNSFE